MKRLLLSAVLVAILGGAAPLHAQGPGRSAPGGPAPAGEVRGTVVSAESGAPVAAASVAVWSAADDGLVAGAITHQNGSFRIEGLRPGRYSLRVSMIGFEIHTATEFEIGEGSMRVDVGTIQLGRRVIALEGVEVSVDRPMMTIAPDRNAYRARDVAPAATSASDVLEQVPSVQVDIDGKVSLRGSENVVVQINGRPSPMRGEQLGAYLRQLPANTIDRVEVIPNPSARYDPDGMAGIINIVLQQNVDLGLSGGLTLAASTADRYNVSGNLGYQRGRTTAFLNYGFIDEERAVRGINDRIRFTDGGIPFSFTEQDVAGINGNNGHNMSANVDLRLGRRDVLTNVLTVNRRGSTDATLSAYHVLDGDREPVDRYDRIRDSDVRNLMFDYTLAFKRTLEPQRHELGAELRFNRQDDRDRTTIWRQPAAAANSVDRYDAEEDLVDALTSQLTGQLDYTRSLAERTKLEAGWKGNVRWMERDYGVRLDSLGTGEWSPSDRSNVFDFDEHVNAVYGVISHGAGRFEMQAGLRAEYAGRDFSLADSGESFPYTYTSLFPSGLVSYSFSDQTRARLSYSRRIRRPGTFELNPFPVFFDVQNVFIGNPELNPEYTDAIELGLQHSAGPGSVQVAPFYRRTTDVIRFIINTTDEIAGREVTSVSFQNLDTGTSWGADVNGTLRLGSIFNGLAGVNLFKMVTEGGGESTLASDAVSWSARLNGTFNISRATSLQASYFYRAPMDIERGRFSSFVFTNVSLRHRFDNDRATLVLRVSDPLDRMLFKVEAGDDDVLQLTERAFNSRAVHLSFQYSVGQAPRARPRRPEAEPEARPGFP